MNIPRMGRVITIWDELFCKLRVSVDGLVTRKKVFLDSSQHIEKYIDVVVEVLKVQSSVLFDLFLDEDFIGSW